MSFGEEIIKLRKRVNDVVKKGLILDDNKNFFEATLVQIMNDAERNRQNCVTQAENLRKQAAMMDGQAGAFASVSSIIYNVLSGFIYAAEKSEEELKRMEKEKSEKEAVEPSNR